MATVLIIKKGRSKSLEIMRLMRCLTWCSAKYNFIIHATDVAGKCNTIADALSRFQMDRFVNCVRQHQFEGEEIIGNVMSNISEDILICFVSYYQSVLELKYSTIKLNLAGIRHFSIANCSVNPLVDSVGKPLLRLQNILNGIKKTENKSVRKNY
ncbi:unnamed protein product [Mytilus coruscus]|uniref:Uncharacterized protein n=1 Tax=Mytilus coruscus TaxID=42192 RepID=A0A6J8DV49_MYTCO|nr:unnamed protein product [Mytilus coruscus]